MNTIVIGDLNTLVGTSNKPGKVAWLREHGIKVDGVQIMSLQQDLFPHNLLRYQQRLEMLFEGTPDLTRVSVALLCWPLIKDTVGRDYPAVAASTFAMADLGFYISGIGRALKYLHDKAPHVSVDISYHPMLTWPTADVSGVNLVQSFLLKQDLETRNQITELWHIFGLGDVGISIENEPTMSDPWANLTHTGNRLFTEQMAYLPKGWGVTADLQHVAMALKCLEDDLDIPAITPPLVNANEATWEGQFEALKDASSVTFHVAQMEDPLRHVTPPLRFDDPIMPWPKILDLMRYLDRERQGRVWYAVEIDGGHNFPEGYETDLRAFRFLQERFGR